jgi:hypothetical protein
MALATMDGKLELIGDLDRREHHQFFRDAKATIWERISGLAPSAPDVAMRRIISACLYAVTDP